MKELVNIQKDLKAPKGQFNKFGNYKYRSAEDILEAVKPLLAANDCTLTITDDIILIGTRIYVKATATLKNGKGEVEATTAFAREDEAKKGMDGSQVTGASSSYARKYALNGLFCIDDTKDADATNTHGKEEAAKPQTAAPTPGTEERLALALQEINAAQSRQTLTGIWNAYKDLQGLPKFSNAVQQASMKFPK